MTPCSRRADPPEARLLHAGVTAELDHHEVGGGGEEPPSEVFLSAEGHDVDRRLLRGASAQDLRRVKVLLRVERRELQVGGNGTCQLVVVKCGEIKVTNSIKKKQPKAHHFCDSV